MSSGDPSSFDEQFRDLSEAVSELFCFLVLRF
jgi:hypothetical protein